MDDGRFHGDGTRGMDDDHFTQSFPENSNVQYYLPPNIITFSTPFLSLFVCFGDVMWLVMRQTYR